MRRPIYAGSFYPAQSEILEKELKNCFAGDKGPGALPGKKSRNIKAIIAPHAGYAYSGQCAAWSYKALGETELADIYIIFAPNHQGVESAVSDDDFKTPFGFVKTDQKFVRALTSKGNIQLNRRAHLYEHSLEVQLPFLQFVLKEDINHHIKDFEKLLKESKKGKQLRIAPILVSNDLDLKQVALDIHEVLMDQDKKAIFIASSDFTHFGPNYRYVPFSDDEQNKITEFDMKAIEFIKGFDAEGFLKYVEDNHATICGAYPITLLLHLIKSGKVSLENYYTSAEISGDKKNSVSYASIIFE